MQAWSSVARPSIPPLRSNLFIYSLFVVPDFVDKCLSAISQRNSALSSRLPTTRFLSPEHSVEEEESSHAVSNPILAPAVSPWGWSPGSGSASSDNRSTSVRTPSQHQFAFDGYFTLTFSLTPSACRQTESRKRARGADPQRGRPVYPDRDDKDLSLLELRLEWSRNPGEISIKRVSVHSSP